MKEMNKKKGPSSNQTRHSAKSDKRENKLQEKNVGKTQKAKGSGFKVSRNRIDSGALVSDSNTESEVSENMDIHYMDDVYRADKAFRESELPKVVEQANKRETQLENDLEEIRMTEESAHITNDSLSSQVGDGHAADDVKIGKSAVVPKDLAKNDVTLEISLTQRMKSDQRTNKLPIKLSNTTRKQSRQFDSRLLKEATKRSNDDVKNMKVHPRTFSESSEGFDDIHLEELKEADNVDVASNSTLSVVKDEEVVHKEKNGENVSQATFNQKIEEMEIRIGKLEEELTAVAALEIALYSVVPEHASSAHKIHTAARRLSRLYLHACKHWSQHKIATVARNIVSGLVFVGRSSGNDVTRLIFWLSNIVVLREITYQAFKNSHQSRSPTKILESNGVATRCELMSSSHGLKSNSSGEQGSKQELMRFFDDWHETETFTTALEKIESWIFSRIVESIWWQTLTPIMQSSSDDSSTNKALERLLGPSLGDQQQGSFSINLWKNAFHDASKRLCPVRATEQECGCFPVLARKVMEQCVRRLDVAMFNAILRESAHEIPTDPVSDPIVDCKVLPIPAGNLSFRSGAQLKNSVGNWSRYLDDLFGMEAEDSVERQNSYDDKSKRTGAEPKSFRLLSELSDLLMIPKDMVVDQTIRMEVCPSISLPLVKRILCNFSPDEFYPDPVPGVVLEALNTECSERQLSGDSASNSFPYTASPVTFTFPFSINVAETVADAGGNRLFTSNASAILQKGYTSDEELKDLDTPLTSMVLKLPSSLAVIINGSHKEKDKAPTRSGGANTRYELLREVWR